MTHKFEKNFSNVCYTCEVCIDVKDNPYILIHKKDLHGVLRFFWILVYPEEIIDFLIGLKEINLCLKLFPIPQEVYEIINDIYGDIESINKDDRKLVSYWISSVYLQTNS